LFIAQNTQEYAFFGPSVTQFTELNDCSLKKWSLATPTGTLANFAYDLCEKKLVEGTASDIFSPPFGTIHNNILLYKVVDDSK